MKEIPLTQGKVALVDDQDFAAMSAFKWSAHRHRRTFYVIRTMRLPDHKQRNERLHRVILVRKLGRPIAAGMQCDHINGDGLDNRRENLCEVSCAQNQRNCRRRKLCPSSRFLGVSWSARDEVWVAQIMIARKCVRIGSYRTELAAAQAREAFIKEHPELHARSNFPAEWRTQ